MLRAALHEQEVRRAIGVPGAGDRTVDGVAPLDAGEDRCLYFVNRRVSDAIRASLAARRGCIVIVPSGSALGDALGDCVVLEAREPRAAIASVLGFVRDEHRVSPLVAARAIAPGAAVSPLAVVEGAVEIGEGAVVSPFCVIGPDVRIGRGTILHPGVRVYPRVVIGDHCVIGANTVVGHQGYGFVRDEAGNKTRMPHLGGVRIGSHADVGAITSVQSGTIVATVIEEYAKVDDLVFVGHNVHVERNASVTAGGILAGHSVIGTEAWLGINASVRDGRRVGAHALVGMHASVQDDLPDEHLARAPRPSVAPRTNTDRRAIGFTER